MAWFQNLAGRAEDLLNKIDQNAATVLSEGNIKVSDNNETPLVPLFISNSKSQEEHAEKSVLKESSSSYSLKLSKSQSSLSSLTELKDELKCGEDVDEPNANVEVTSEKYTDLVNGNLFERPSKSDSPSSKSSSLHNSFILYEDTLNFNEKINKLELENNDLNKQLLNLQHLYAELRNENANLLSQVDTANYLAANAQSEMEQYRARAQRILQEKEELIGLKQYNNSTDDSSDIFHNYSEELKKELEFQQNKNTELNEKLKELTQETLFLKQQIVLMQNSSHQSTQTLQQNLAAEKKIRLIAEDECKLKSQELHIKMQELSQQYSTIKLKNEEIDNLKEALKQRTNTNINEDFESRIKSLTETLMLKQNTLETVTTERNALRIQLEKLENEYHNNLAQLQRAQVRVINVNDTDDVKSQVPQFMRVSPLDAGVTRRVKHAYSTVDAISVRTGIFLRRYPLARVFVFCYMVLLHLWALVILFLYAPSNR